MHALNTVSRRKIKWKERKLKPKNIMDGQHHGIGKYWLQWLHREGIREKNMKNYYSSAYWMQMTPGDDDDDFFIKYFFLISFHPKCYNELFTLSNKSCHLFPHSFLSSHYILLMLYPCVIRIKGLGLLLTGTFMKCKAASLSLPSGIYKALVLIPLLNITIKWAVCIFAT